MPESLLSLVELTATVASGPDRPETLDKALAIVARELQVSRVALFVRGDAEGTFVLRASRGLAPEAPRSLCHPRPFEELTGLVDGEEARDRHGLVLLCPIQRRDRPLALLGLGPRQIDREYGDSERAFLRGVFGCLATAVASGATREELRRLSLQRARDLVQLRDLLDVGRELTLSADEAAVHERLATVVMGHFVVSRCAVYRLAEDGLSLAHARGLRRGSESAPLSAEAARATLEGLEAPRPVAEVPEGALRTLLLEARLSLAVPLAARERSLGLLAIGERSSGTPFTDEDLGFAQAL
ncbi:MAG TPA: GAF domain-containing protein, partial [Vicinamibacteria bacterium]|nr:GAF domain-containing protein [Vicinamibacteria bacterium]